MSGLSSFSDRKASEELTAAEKAQVGAVFAKLDRNGNGTLDKMELIVGLRELKHPKPTLATVESMLAEVNLSNAEQVNLEEFEAMWKNKASSNGGWAFSSASDIFSNPNAVLLSTTSAVGDSLSSGFSSMADALATAARDPSAAAAGAASSAANWSPSAAFAAATGGINGIGSSFGGSPRPAPITNESYSSVYDLGKQVGSGAYSTVYLATRKDSPGTDYAIKVVKKADVPDKEDIDALLEEVGILQQITHPHVMRLYEFYEDDETYALVTEMVVGGELFDRVVELQHYSEREARDLVVILLRTLDFLHSNGVVHRDLKPENLLLASKQSDVNIKLADFGFAKHTSQRLDTVCGTPDYIAPEVCALLDLKKVPRSQRPPYNELCDIWSAGVVVYILLGGYPPFFDDNRKKLFGKIKRGEYEFHEQYWKDVSVEAKDLISQMLTVDPAQRPSAQRLLEHPWLAQSPELLRTKGLGGTQAELKRWTAKRRLKAATRSIMAVRRMGGIMGGLKKV